jgi:hypothetical protein
MAEKRSSHEQAKATREPVDTWGNDPCTRPNHYGNGKRLEGELCGRSFGRFIPCTLPADHEGACK